jgi:hypothetical protein
VVVLAAVGVALYLLLGKNGDSTTAVSDPSTTTQTTSEEATTSESGPSAAGIPEGAVPPDGLGDDAVFDQLAQECYDGDMASCDALYETTKDDDSLATYNEYADTCAGRQEVNTSVYCTNAFPGD